MKKKASRRMGGRQPNPHDSRHLKEKLAKERNYISKIQVQERAIAYLERAVGIKTKDYEKILLENQKLKSLVKKSGKVISKLARDMQNYANHTEECAIRKLKKKGRIPRVKLCTCGLEKTLSDVITRAKEQIASKAF